MNWYKKSNSSSKDRNKYDLKIVVKDADSPKDNRGENKEIVDYCKRHGITSVTRDR